MLSPTQRAFLSLHELDHDASRAAHESETQSRVAGQRTNGDLGSFGAQLLNGGVHVIDGQADMLQPVCGKEGAVALSSCGCGGAISTVWPHSRTVMRCCPG